MHSLWGARASAAVSVRVHSRLQGPHPPLGSTSAGLWRPRGFSSTFILATRHCDVADSSALMTRKTHSGNLRPRRPPHSPCGRGWVHIYIQVFIYTYVCDSVVYYYVCCAGRRHDHNSSAILISVKYYFINVITHCILRHTTQDDSHVNVKITFIYMIPDRMIPTLNNFLNLK